MQTARLYLTGLERSDAKFIEELTNTEGWLKFIGNRHIKNVDDALVYIEKILNSPNITYWVVRITQTNEAVGIITFMKRDYLEDFDIGFAFLPRYTGNGYAIEAASAVLESVKNLPQHATVLATTLGENERSVRLLEKMGFRYVRQLRDKQLELSVYANTNNTTA